MKGLRYYRGYTIRKGQYAINGEPKAYWWVGICDGTKKQFASRLLKDVVKLIDESEETRIKKMYVDYFKKDKE